MLCLILGDNIFYMGDQFHTFKEAVKNNEGKCATVFAYHVSDPERFGVVEFDQNFNAISIEEKPKQPKSNYASVGLYFYPSDVVEKARNLKPSARSELEITDLNNLYLQEKRMSVVPMRRGNAWLDAGTPDSLMESGAFYNTDFIWEDLIATQKMSVLRNNLHLNYYLPKEVNISSKDSKLKVALVFFVYYEDLVDECLNYIKSMPLKSNIYIIFAKDNLLDSYKKLN